MAEPQENILERMHVILRCVEGIYAHALKENDPEKLQRWLYLLSLGYQVLQCLPEISGVDDLLTAYKSTIDKILAVTISESGQLAEPSSSWFNSFYDTPSSWFNFRYDKTAGTMQEYVVEGFIDYLIGSEETEEEKSDRYAFKIAISLYPQYPKILENAFSPGVFIKEEDVEARWRLLEWLQSKLETEKKVFISEMLNSDSEEIKIFDRTTRVVKLSENIECNFSEINKFLIEKRNLIEEEKSKLFLLRLNEEVLTTAGSVFFSSKKNNPKVSDNLTAGDLTTSVSVIDLLPSSAHSETERRFFVLYVILWIAQKSRMFLNLIAQCFYSYSNPKNNTQDAHDSEEASLINQTTAESNADLDREIKLTPS
jgi:hypothetical protein